MHDRPGDPAGLPALWHLSGVHLGRKELGLLATLLPNVVTGGHWNAFPDMGSFVHAVGRAGLV